MDVMPSATIHVELPDDDRAALERAAANHGVTLEEYIRRLLELAAIDRREIEGLIDQE